MPTDRRLHRIRDVVRRRQRDLTLVLEDIHDPHNAEAVLRTCDVFGVQHVHLVFARQAPFNPRKLGKSTSSSANKWLDFTLHTSVQACLLGLRANGFELVATVADPAADSLSHTDLCGDRLALLFGNEHDGLSHEALRLADRRVTIPSAGMVQSLNLSVAAAVCLYEVTRQRGRDPDRYALDAKERARLEQDLQRRA